MDYRAWVSRQRQGRTTKRLSKKAAGKAASVLWAIRFSGTTPMLALCPTSSRGAVLTQAKPLLREGITYPMLLKSMPLH